MHFSMALGAGCLAGCGCVYKALQACAEWCAGLVGLGGWVGGTVWWVLFYCELVLV